MCMQTTLLSIKRVAMGIISGAGIFVALPLSAHAVCPVCAVAVGAGVGLSRYLGVDDTITGTWIGALVVALIMWTISFLQRRSISFFAREAVTIIVYYALIVVPLVWSDIVGHPDNTLWGIDKLLFGIVVGSIVFFAAVTLYEWMKKKNGDKAHFPFEKIVIPVGTLLLMSGIWVLVV